MAVHNNMQHNLHHDNLHYGTGGNGLATAVATPMAASGALPNGRGQHGVADAGSKRGRPKARSKWLQVRMSEEERNRLDRVAANYGMDASGFIRAVISYCETSQPDLPGDELEAAQAGSSMGTNGRGGHPEVAIAN